MVTDYSLGAFVANRKIMSQLYQTVFEVSQYISIINRFKYIIWFNFKMREEYILYFHKAYITLLYDSH